VEDFKADEVSSSSTSSLYNELSKSSKENPEVKRESIGLENFFGNPLGPTGGSPGLLGHGSSKAEEKIALKKSQLQSGRISARFGERIPTLADSSTVERAPVDEPVDALFSDTQKDDPLNQPLSSFLRVPTPKNEESEPQVH